MQISANLVSYKIKSFLKREKTIEVFFLVFLFFISLFFRFYDFPNRIGWDSDSGRDFLAGYLISHQAEHTIHGHWNSGINFVYPSYYYYFIAMVELVSDSAEFIVGIFVFLHALSVMAIYFIGKKLFSKLSAGGAAFLYGVSPLMISISLFPLSAYFGLLIFLISLLFLTSFVVDEKNKFLLLGIALLVLSSTVFYGALLFLPIYGVIVLIKYLQGKKSLHTLYLFIIFSLICFLILFSPLILNGNLYDLVGLNKYSPIGIKESIYLQDVFQKTYIEFSNMFPNKTHIAAIFYILISIYFFIKKKMPVFFPFFLFIFVYHVILFCLKKDSLSHYLILLTPFYFLAIGSFLQASLISGRKLNLFFVAIFLSSLFFIGANNFHSLTTARKGKSFQTYQELSTFLMQTYPNYDFTMTERSSHLFWNSRSIWYFFRKESTFFLSPAGKGQVELKPRRAINICEQNMDKSENYCDDLADGFNWKIMKVITVDQDPTIFNLYSQ